MRAAVGVAAVFSEGSSLEEFSTSDVFYDKGSTFREKMFLTDGAP